MTAHVVSHTHWDRAWYRPFQGFRIRLVRLFDKLMDILERVPGYTCFTLDGQSAVFDDYLEIRPGDLAKLRELVQRKRIFAGPWYVLPDEFLVSPEALIRNLMLGHKVAAKLGRVSKVGYLPDPFGHVSQMPMILAGFGIDNFIFTRGLGDEGEKLGSEFAWESRDGNSRVLAIHQRDGYANASYLGHRVSGSRWEKAFDLDRALEQLADACRKLKSVTNSRRNLLLNNGFDHAEPQAELPEILAEANKKLTECRFVHSSFERYIEALKRENLKLKTYRGEMRSGRYAELLSGVLSSRVYLKQMNEACQTLYERYVEPIAALAWLAGRTYPDDFIWRGWRYIILNHPHDDICGCSIDQVHRDMEYRFDQARLIGEELVTDGLDYVAANVDTSAAPGGAVPIVFFNTTSYRRKEVCQVNVHLPEALKDGPLALEDGSGQAVAFQVLRGTPVIEADAWGMTKATEAELLAELEVPPCGYRTYFLKKAASTKAAAGGVIVTARGMENEYLKVDCGADGSLNVCDKRCGRSYRKWLVFEDGGDDGDEYDYSAPDHDAVFTTAATSARVKVLDRGPLRGVFEVQHRLRMPEHVSSTLKKRTGRNVALVIRSLVTIRKGSPRIDIETTVHNNARDHRLRVLFPTGMKATCSKAESHFDVVERPVDTPNVSGWRQQPAPCHPQQAFVSIDEGGHGVTLFNRGLPEYEVLKKRSGCVHALTLFRSVGYLSKADVKGRGRNVGPPLATPEAQCLKKMVFRYAVMPHAGAWHEADCYGEGVRFRTPVRGAVCAQGTRGSRRSRMPSETSTLSVEPACVSVSALKKSERGARLVVRLYNAGLTKTTAVVKTHRKFRSVRPCNLGEVPVQDSSVKVSGSNTVKLKLGPFQVKTLLMQF